MGTLHPGSGLLHYGPSSRKSVSGSTISLPVSAHRTAQRHSPDSSKLTSQVSQRANGRRQAGEERGEWINDAFTEVWRDEDKGRQDARDTGAWETKETNGGSENEVRKDRGTRKAREQERVKERRGRGVAVRGVQERGWYKG